MPYLGNGQNSSSAGQSDSITVLPSDVSNLCALGLGGSSEYAFLQITTPLTM